MVTALILLSSFAAAAQDVPFQYSFTIWDWEPAYRDFTRFQQQVDACAANGVTVMEIGVSWKDCEPVDNQFDFSIIDSRVAYVQSEGLGLRLRVDVIDYPECSSPECFTNADGTRFDYGRGIPSLFNSDNRAHQYRFVTALAAHFQGKSYTYTPAFSVHMEVKFAAWNSYEPSARAAYRAWLAGRYSDIASLNGDWHTQFASFAEIEPATPQPTAGAPSLNAADNDWIRFREETLRDWVAGFAAAVRTGDKSARISVPLGESCRKDSAAFANLAYWPYSRTADEVVHSYDFFMHGAQHTGDIALAVATMSGITQLPVVFEIDGPILLEKFGYTTDQLVEMARTALDTGAAGIQIANWGGSDLAAQPWMRAVGDLVRNRNAQGPWKMPPDGGVLYYVSKWQNYCFRDTDEHIYETQFALLRALRTANIACRVVTDENLLHEPLWGKTVLLPGTRLIDAPVRDRLRAMSMGGRLIADEKPGLYTASEETKGNFGAKAQVLGQPFPTDPHALAQLLTSHETTKVLRVAAVQFHTSFDVAKNAVRIVEYINRAADKGARVAAFTEMALTGYTKTADFRATLDWTTIDVALELIKSACKARNIYALVGAPTREGDQIFCAALMIDPNGTIVDAYEKTYLAGEKWATPGRKLSIFEIDDVKCGTIVCHDERYPHLVQLRALAGAQLFFYISCESGLDEEHKIAPYRAQVQARAVENGVFFVHANAPASREFPFAEGTSNGHSRIVGPDGNLIDEAGAYDDTIVIADIDLGKAHEAGMPASLTNGPAAAWIREGLGLITGGK